MKIFRFVPKRERDRCTKAMKIYCIFYWNVQWRHMDSHCQKRRGLAIEEMGNESIIHWSGPPLHLASLVKSRWIVFTRVIHGISSRKWESTVLKKICTQKSLAPFFLIYIRMCLIRDLHDLRISNLYFIVSYIQVLRNFA